MARKDAPALAARDVVEGRWELAPNGRWPLDAPIFEVWRERGGAHEILRYLVVRDGAETTCATLAEAETRARGDPL